MTQAILAFTLALREYRMIMEIAVAATLVVLALTFAYLVVKTLE